MPLTSSKEVRASGDDAFIDPMDTGPSSQWDSLLNHMQNTINRTLEHREKSISKQTQLMVVTKQLKISARGLDSNIRNLDIGNGTRDIIMGMIEQVVAEYDAAIKDYREECDSLTIRCAVTEGAFQSVATTLQRDLPGTTSMTGSLTVQEEQLNQLREDNSKLILEKKYLKVELEKVIEEISSYKAKTSTLSRDERGELNELRIEGRKHDTSIRNLERKIETIQAAQRLQFQGQARMNVTDSNSATRARLTLNPSNQPLDEQLQIILKYQQDVEHQMNEFSTVMKSCLGSIESGYEKNFGSLNETVKALFAKASEGSAMLSAKRSSEIVEKELGRMSNLPAELSSRPKTLMDLWLEYATGLGGRKPAKHFTHHERGKVKARYCRRKVFWDCVTLHIRGGYTAATAIERIQSVYGLELSVTNILSKLIEDRRTGGNPNLKV